MGSRDHSYECDDCGEMRGGMNDYVCRCGPLPTLSAEFVACLLADDDEFERMCAWRRTLAANLAVGGALCAAFRGGYDEGWTERASEPYGARTNSEEYRMMRDKPWWTGWRPGCGRAWGGGA